MSGRPLVVGVLAWFLLVQFLVGGVAGWPGVVAVHLATVGVVVLLLRRRAYRQDRDAIGLLEPGFSTVRKAVNRGELPADETLWPAVRALVDHRRSVVGEMRASAGWLAFGGSAGTVVFAVLSAAYGDPLGRVVFTAVLFGIGVALLLIAAGREEPVLDDLDHALGATPSIVPATPQPPPAPWEEPAGSYQWPAGTAEWPEWSVDPAAARPPAPSSWPAWTAERPDPDHPSDPPQDRPREDRR